MLKCETSQLDSDRAKFTLATRDAHKTGVKLTGTMQRWEGDRTRIDVDVVLNTSSQVRTQHQLSDSSNTSMTIIILFGVMLMFFRVLGDRNFWSPGTIPQLLVLMGVLIVALRIFPMEAKRRARSKADRALFTAQRSADGLTGLLVEAFTQYDVQWIPSKPS
ncbi:MAG: hypothetical protein H6672_14945 [Anaerolineaceae bacterium]|nr:hypothetical protein [Anaerolineaceae bacterium]